MNEDFIVESFKVLPHPKGMVLTDKNVQLEPLNLKKHMKNDRNINLGTVVT